MIKMQNNLRKDTVRQAEMVIVKVSFSLWGYF